MKKVEVVAPLFISKNNFLSSDSFEKWKIWEKENEIKRREKAILSNKKTRQS